MLLRVVILFLLAMVVIGMVGRHLAARKRIQKTRNAGLLGRKCPECGVWNAIDERCRCGAKDR